MMPGIFMVLIFMFYTIIWPPPQESQELIILGFNQPCLKPLITVQKAQITPILVTSLQALFGLTFTFLGQAQEQ